jgi:hypothetical protein
MTKSVTMMRINDETGDALVVFEDTDSGAIFRMGVTIPAEFETEDAILDYLSAVWPHKEMAMKGRAPADRHAAGKALVGVKKDIVG